MKLREKDWCQNWKIGQGLRRSRQVSKIYLAPQVKKAMQSYLSNVFLRLALQVWHVWDRQVFTFDQGSDLLEANLCNKKKENRLFFRVKTFLKKYSKIFKIVQMFKIHKMILIFSNEMKQLFQVDFHLKNVFKWISQQCLSADSFQKISAFKNISFQTEKITFLTGNFIEEFSNENVFFCSGWSLHRCLIAIQITT